MTNTAAIGNITKKQKSGRAYAFILAILPVVMMYQFPGLQYGSATILILLGALLSGLMTLSRIDKIEWRLISILSLYIGYSIFMSAGLNFILPLAIIVHISAISTGIVNSTYLRKYIEFISVLAAISVILQQAVHVATGNHIPLINVNWLIDELVHYAPLVNSGYGHEAMYRPSAFFLEPAHFAQYVIFGLGSSLFRNNPNMKRAILLSFGLFATTSGMGFVLTFGIWGWWYLNYMRRKTRKGVTSTIIIIVVVAVIALAFLSNIPFFADIISRFTGSGNADYNAIDGRLFFWDSLFGSEDYQSLMFGFGEQALLKQEVYFTGFMKILYAYGIVGFVLFALFILYLLIHVKNYFAKMYVIIYIGLLFLANLAGFINIIFFIGTTLVFSQISFSDIKTKMVRSKVKHHYAL